MLFIQNVGAGDIPKGDHFACGENSMLIQITDVEVPGQHTTPWIPEPKHKFKEIHQFEFLDIEDSDPYVNKYGITEEQAAQIVELLKHALENRMQVVVHCFAGVCRSGAVAEVGVMMGFADAKSFRIPNTRVKRLMMKALGWTYDSEEKDVNDASTVIEMTKEMK